MKRRFVDRLKWGAASAFFLALFFTFGREAEQMPLVPQIAFAFMCFASGMLGLSFAVLALIDVSEEKE